MNFATIGRSQRKRTQQQPRQLLYYNKQNDRFVEGQNRQEIKEKKKEKNETRLMAFLILLAFNHIARRINGDIFC